MCVFQNAVLRSLGEGLLQKLALGLRLVRVRFGRGLGWAIVKGCEYNNMRTIIADIYINSCWFKLSLEILSKLFKVGNFVLHEKNKNERKVEKNKV